MLTNKSLFILAHKKNDVKSVKDLIRWACVAVRLCSFPPFQNRGSLVLGGLK